MFEEELRKMIKRKTEKTTAAVLTLVCIFLTLLTFSTNFVSAIGGSIAVANTYPENGEAYNSVDHFAYQLTDVNTNTTVSVSIDNGPLISMAYEGAKNEVFFGDTVARQWYSWRVTVPAILTHGKHTFQFFSHYYVWQEQDHYWAEFNACSTIRSFTIAGSSSAPTQALPTTISNPVYVIVAIASPLFGLLLLVSIKTRKGRDVNLTTN
jgi:hypothetical protein